MIVLRKAERKEVLRQGLAYPFFMLGRVRRNTVEALKEKGLYDDRCCFTLVGAKTALLLVNEYRLGRMDRSGHFTIGGKR